jgi:hypothetical protein
VTSQGSACGRFRRALDRGNVTEALSEASELRFVGLLEALELCLLLRDKAAGKYGCAAVRWHSRFAQELPGVTVENRKLSWRLSEQSQAIVVSRCSRVGGPPNGHRFEQAAELLTRWSESRGLGQS